MSFGLKYLMKNRAQNVYSFFVVLCGFKGIGYFLSVLNGIFRNFHFFIPGVLFILNLILLLETKWVIMYF
jgi:hypothetical protein